MPTFTQALTVTPGERTTADQVASLAAAFNSRLPYADCVWRVLFYFHSLFRQMRNPNEGFTAYPADAEWWNFYQHVEPDDGEWPQTGPGDPEGSNMANIMNAFVYGPESIDIGSELYALASVPTGITGIDVLEPRHIWYLGQIQRGAHDPETGASLAPAFDVARRYAYIRQGLTSMHGNAYGGFGARPTTDYIFNQLPAVGSESRTYSTSTYDVSYTPWAYYVFDSSGVVEILPKSEWTEGPYTGESYLRKTSANLLARALSNYASEFRGMETQGAGTTNRHAFDLQKFLTTQYPLAPNYGTTVGGSVQPLYPNWQASTSLPGGVQVGASVTWPEGTVCTGFLVVGHLLTRACTVELVENGDVIHTLTVGTGDSDQIWWLTEARRLADLRVRLGSDLELDTGGQLFIEATCLIEYKPQIHDWYFVTRLSSYNGSLNRIDGRGIDFDRAKELGEALYDNGCVIPLVDTGDGLGPAAFDPTFNQNAVYDSARRWVRSMARIIPRWNLTGYAVEGGKSVLWFNRTAYGPPGLPTRDMFQDIGPAQEAIASGSIKWGRRYKVTAGSVSYGSAGDVRSYSVGQEFTGLRGVTEFAGGGTVKEADGIKATAEPRDWSNRWLLTLTLKPYSNSNSSLWKTDAFADQITPFWQRCHFRSDELPYTDEYIDHLCPSARDLDTYGVTDFPEAPSQLNFGRINGSFAGDSYANQWDGSGDPDDVARFYKSCRLYEPSIEIESAVMDGDELKVTLKSRLHSHEDAPASIDRDPSTWDTTALAAEDYRTHENGVRDYIAWQALGINSQWKVGDDSINSDLQTNPDAPLGCCLPTFMLLKMIPEPYLDGNDTRQEHDSYRTHDQLKQAEVYLRAMCEGFVDGVSTAENACNFGYISAFDYSFENLMFQAAGNRWVPLDLTVRPDNPFTFGPGPNQRFYAEQFNALANGVNLLTDLRIMLPSQIEQRSIQGDATSVISAKDQCGDPLPCSSKGTRWFAQSFGSLSATAGATFGSWGPWGGSTGTNYSGAPGTGTNAGYQMDSTCSGDNWTISASITEQEIRWSLTDPDSVYALPGDLASLLETNAVITAQFSDIVSTTSIVYGPTPGEPVDAALAGLCGSQYAWYVLTDITNVTYCGSPVTRIVPPAIPAGAMTNVQWDTSGLPGTVRGSGGSSGRSISLYSDGTSLIRCPTVAYSGGS